MQPGSEFLVTDDRAHGADHANLQSGLFKHVENEVGCCCLAVGARHTDDNQ